MKTPASRIAIVMICLTSLPVLRAEDDAPKPITMEKALRLGPEKLAEETDASEAGQDQACELYGAAKRLETENKLAARDLRLVTELESWRQPLARCAAGFPELAYGLNGGGTMYSHAANRSSAELEDFLSKFSKGLPLGDGKGDKDSLAKLDRLIAFTAKLAVPKATEAEIAKAFKEQRAELLNSLKEMKSMCSYAPAAQSKAVIAFLVGQATWIEYPESTKK